MTLHHVEAAWRRFRGGLSGEILRQSLALRASYVDHLGIPRLPNEVALPGAVPWNILARREAEARGDATGDHLSGGGTIVANSCAVWAAYREAKTIYTVEPLLVEALVRTPWPDDVPTAALRLPSRCPVLSLPWDGELVHVAAHYDLLTQAEASGRLELRLSILAGDHWSTISILHLVADDLASCLRDASHVTDELVDARAVPLDDRPPAGTGLQVWHTDLAGLVLTILLYLGGEPDIVRQVHPGANPDREARIRRRDPERWRDLHDPEVYTVGPDYRAAIERWEIEQAIEHGEPTGRTVRPHMRRAHAHLYWVGHGRELPRIKFLLPIPVHGAQPTPDPSGPTETQLR